MRTTTISIERSGTEYRVEVGDEGGALVMWAEPGTPLCIDLTDVEQDEAWERIYSQAEDAA